MVRSEREGERRLGWVLTIGSLAGVGLSSVCALALLVLGVDLNSWRLDLCGAWPYDYPVLHLLGGLGLLLLGATPVFMLLWVMIQSWLDGRRREALTGFGVLLVLAGSLWTILARLF